MNELDRLYQQVILDHSRERHGAGALADPDATSHQVNPTCGDEVELGVRIDGDRIGAVGWQGEGCSISQASISVMHDLVEDGAAVEGVSKYPNRVKCALRGWMALRDALVKAGVALPSVDGPDST